MHTRSLKFKFPKFIFYVGGDLIYLFIIIFVPVV